MIDSLRKWKNTSNRRQFVGVDFQVVVHIQPMGISKQNKPSEKYEIWICLSPNEKGTKSWTEFVFFFVFPLMDSLLIVVFHIQMTHLCQCSWIDDKHHALQIVQKFQDSIFCCSHKDRSHPLNDLKCWDCSAFCPHYKTEQPVWNKWFLISL